MKNLLFLIKFGEKKWIDEFANGNLYFNNANGIEKIEVDTKKRGQGDKYEGMTRFDCGTYSVNIAWGEHIKQRPFICFTGCFEKDIAKDKNQYRIVFSKQIEVAIKEHFDKADTAAIITRPQQFFNDIKNAYSCAVIDHIRYFNKENDYEMLPFIATRELPRPDQFNSEEEYKKALHSKEYRGKFPKLINGNTCHYVITEDNAYNGLFTKDDYFFNEQETRIILKDLIVDEGKVYKFCLSEKIKTYSLNEVFSGSLLMDC